MGGASFLPSRNAVTGRELPLWVFTRCLPTRCLSAELVITFVVTEVCVMADAALRLKGLADQLLGVPFPLRIRAWDGAEAGPPEVPVLVGRGRPARRRL